MVLFVAGAVLLPGGLVVIGLGWYGTAHTPYEYDQNAYLISGGILGLGITFVGGFLYFGSWLARLAAGPEGRRSSSWPSRCSKLADAVLRSNAAVVEADRCRRFPPSGRPGQPQRRRRAAPVLAGRRRQRHDRAPGRLRPDRRS